jgi:hypothetical protein
MTEFFDWYIPLLGLIFSAIIELTGQPSQDNYTIGFADNRFGGSATAFPAFKVSAQKGLF